MRTCLAGKEIRKGDHQTMETETGTGTEEKVILGNLIGQNRQNMADVQNRQDALDGQTVLDRENGQGAPNVQNAQTIPSGQDGAPQARTRWGGIDGYTLKCIAMASMLIDHTGMALFPQYPVMRVIGRLAFPIYCFLLAEGAAHTSSHSKYLLRLFLFALVSEVPFDLASSMMAVNNFHQNVFFTLFLALLAMTAIQKLPNRWLAAVAVAACVLMGDFLRTDYGAGGVLIAVLFFLLRKHPVIKSVAFAVADIGLWGLSNTQAFAVFAVVPILCYNGKRGRGLKYLFYIFYPAHLLVLYLIRFVVWHGLVG